MPIKSTVKKPEIKSVATSKQESCCSDGQKKCCSSHDCHGVCHGSGHFGKKIVLTLVGVLLVYLIFFLGTIIRNNLKANSFIGLADKNERMITVTGMGTVDGSNDVAVTTLGYSNVDKDVAKAQEANKKVMDQVMGQLSKLGIEDKDIKSDYSIYPEYSYLPEEGQKLVGYRVNNTVTIKIRDLSKIENVLSIAGLYGANEVGGLQFTIDDDEVLKEQARDKALVDAKKKADYLSATLGIKLGSVINYNEYSSGDDPYMKYSSMDSMGIGGGTSSAVPPMSAGSKEITTNINITYEILQ
jgi:hypothetical protein